MPRIVLRDRTRRHRPPARVLDRIARALTVQIRRDFAPRWGFSPVEVTVGGRGQPIYLFDDAADAETLGFHDTDRSGNPFAHVFAAPSLEYGSGWLTGPYAISAATSHEALEMLGDQNANRYAYDGRGHLWAFEVCDAVEARSYRIRGVPVCNFVLPDFFNRRADGPYDHLEVLRRPFTLDHGGYAIVDRATSDAQRSRRARTFQVRFAPGYPKWRKPLKLAPATRTSWIRLRADADAPSR